MKSEDTPLICDNELTISKDKIKGKKSSKKRKFRSALNHVAILRYLLIHGNVEHHIKKMRPHKGKVICCIKHHGFFSESVQSHYPESDRYNSKGILIVNKNIKQLVSIKYLQNNKRV